MPGRRCSAPTSKVTPSTTNVTPLARPSHGYTLSGANVCDAVSTSPSTSTPTVCVAATVTPMSSPSRTVPRSPTRYAAITVLPCPGANAWSAPRPIPMARATSASPTVSRRAATDAVNERVHWSNPRTTDAVGLLRPTSAPGAAAPPGRTRSSTRRTSGGELVRSFGYAVRRLLIERAGSGLPASVTPSPRAVISRHPIRSLRFVSATARSCAPAPSVEGSAARSRHSSRKVSSPACPGGKLSAPSTRCMASACPSSVMWTPRASASHAECTYAVASAALIWPSPLRSMEGFVWNVGISAMSTT